MSISIRVQIGTDQRDMSLADLAQVFEGSDQEFLALGDQDVLGFVRSLMDIPSDAVVSRPGTGNLLITRPFKFGC